jgi:hypothetical protein
MVTASSNSQHPEADYDGSYLSIRTRDVLPRILRGDATWEQRVPAAVAEIIETESLFGRRSRQLLLVLLGMSAFGTGSIL